MTDKIKNYALAGLLLLLIITSVTAIIYYRKSEAAQAQPAANKVLDNPVVPENNHYVDNLGLHHSEIKVSTNIIAAGTQKDTSARRIRMIDSVAKALKIADETRIQEVTSDNLQLLAENVKLHQALDSTGKLSYGYADKWLQLAYHPADTTADLRYGVNLKTVRFNRKSGLLGLGNTPMLDFYADDPRATINGFSHFSVTQPDPLFRLTANVRTAYDFATGKLIPSAGVLLEAGKFTLGARYYYSPVTHQLQPLASIGYNFLKLQR